MKHKFPGSIPSLGWLQAALRKYIDQRVTFQVTKNSYINRYLEDRGFNIDQPIFIDAVFKEVYKKRSGNWSFHENPKECVPVLVFRDVIFCQGTKELQFRSHRKYNKRSRLGFELTEIHGNWALFNQGSFTQVSGLVSHNPVSP